LFGILGEDSSDVETLTVIVRRLAGNESLPIKTKGFGGSGGLLTKGRRILELMAAQGCDRFVVCIDADGPNPQPNYQRVVESVTEPAEVDAAACIVIPVQELEAWILADIQAVSRILSSWTPQPVKNPEGIAKPKEHLVRLSRKKNAKPRYITTVHNGRVAEYLNLGEVMRKCPSFLPLREFVLANSH